MTNGSGSLPLERLTPAERRVVDELIHGRSNQAIANALVLSEATVRTHLTSIYAKLEVESRAELLAALIGSGSTSERTTEPTSLVPQGAAEPSTGILVAGILGLAAVVVSALLPVAAIVLGPAILVVGYPSRSRPVGRFRWVRTASLLIGVGLTIVGVAVAIPVLLLGSAG
jgi:DNA-binding CsgD family transcriptional regulator